MRPLRGAPLRSEDFAYKLVVAVRSDLKLSRGKLAVQVAHAAVTCAQQASRKEKRSFKAWLREGQKKVAVKVPDLAALRELEGRAKAAGLTTALISDAGHTEVEPGTVTCLGLGPAANERLDPLTGDLALL